MTIDHDYQTVSSTVIDLIHYYGKISNGLYFLDVDDLSPGAMEEYLQAKIREEKFNTECVHETNIDEMILDIVGKDMDYDLMSDFVAGIKEKMAGYYKKDLQEEIERELMELNFPEDECAPESFYRTYSIEDKRDTLSYADRHPGHLVSGAL